MTFNALTRDSLARLTRAGNLRGGWRLAGWLNRLLPMGQTTITLPDVGRCRLDPRDVSQVHLFWAGLDRVNRQIIHLMQDRLPSDGVFIDAGANIGIHTLAAARHLRAGQVIAFEPHPENYRALRANLEENGLSNVQTEQLGLSDRTATLSVHGPDHSGNWSLASTGSKDFRVSLVRLDDYLEAHPVAGVHLLKMDIEGSEVKALRGAAETVRRYRPAIVFEANAYWLGKMGSSLEELFGTLEGFEYRIHHLTGGESGLGAPITGRDLAGMGGDALMNLAAVPREGTAGPERRAAERATPVESVEA